MAESTNIESRNMLSQLNFKFQIKRAPSVNFFIQVIDTGGIQIDPGYVPNPFIKYPVISDHMTYDDLTFSFKVDEELQNYMEIYSWIKGIGKPDSFEESKQFDDRSAVDPQDGYYSDVSVLLLNNVKETGFEVKYIDAFPVKLSGMKFMTNVSDVKYIGATATFKYTTYDILKYNI